MKKLMHTGLVAAQLLVVVAILVSTIIMLMHPVCIKHMLEEVAGAVSAGILLAFVRVLTRLTRPNMECQPISVWGCSALKSLRRELKSCIVAGYLLGVVLAMLDCLGG